MAVDVARPMVAVLRRARASFRSRRDRRLDAVHRHADAERSLVRGVGCLASLTMTTRGMETVAERKALALRDGRIAANMLEGWADTRVRRSGSVGWRGEGMVHAEDAHHAEES